MSAPIENIIDWYHVGSIFKNQVQSEQQYLEQKIVIKMCKESIDTYCNIMT